MTAKKNTWGGKRPGSGSKPKDVNEKAKTISLSVSAEMHREIKNRADAEGSTVNDFIRSAVKKVLKKTKQS